MESGEWTWNALSEETSIEMLLPYGPMLAKTQKKKKEKKNNARGPWALIDALLGHLPDRSSY